VVRARYACHSMSEIESQEDVEQARRGGWRPGRAWVWGMAILLVVVMVFHRWVFGLIGKMGSVLFTPILLEISLGVFGMGVVFFINHLLRREQRDEWVEMEVGDDDR